MTQYFINSRELRLYIALAVCAGFSLGSIVEFGKNFLLTEDTIKNRPIKESKLTVFEQKWPTVYVTPDTSEWLSKGDPIELTLDRP